ncbi:Serine/threonine-protein kinase PrkC [Gimesia panareensis]|uniref:Serine/threonine-protein kinase PrkC n=1 Tax=Gimesia panareensis TaxID=2527978 RepID=A0A518FLI8_9PLAN|nr:serine/threonine-protein kinase [Gimesia panareensis]QDV17236.1 Serine/threonine-protein kinase PrkC [Gimesia panareensis]
MNQPFELENLTAEIQCRIEECCEEYEASWQNGESPSLEETLADFTPPTREILLKELILIERYYKLRDTGKIVSEQELIQQHPEIADELSRLFARSHATQTRIAGESDSGLADSSGLRTVQESRLHFEQFPAQFGRYQILSRLGEGGMGCVYLARDTQLERKVALKLPQIDRHADTQFISRFYREARAAANLNHPNLCSVYDVDEIDGVHYITMEFIEGESLAALIQSGKRFPQQEIALLIKELSQALDLAHQQGIVHRDLKPANIMIREDGTPIITDFGLALMSQNEETTQITHHGQIMGSPSYMSPEQVDGDLEKIGPASDIYSLGVIMYELLAGQRPFQGSTASILSQIMTKDPRPVRNIQPDIDVRLDQICRKMMGRSTEQRYATMQEVSQVLTNWLETEQAVSSRKRLSPGKLFVGMTLAAALLLGIIFLKPTASPGTLHVTLNDARAQVLLDGQPLELKSGSWNGPQTPGSHELSLQIGDQRLPWGELTKVKSEGHEQRVLASVNGIPLKNGRFEIAADSTESAEIKLSWLPVEQKIVDKNAEVGLPVKQQPVVSKPTEPETRPTYDEQIAVEREVAEWLIGLGAKVHYRLANGGKSADSVDSLPDEPFLVSQIHFENAGKKKLSLPNMSRLNRLLALQTLDVSDCRLEPGALSQLRFGNTVEAINVDHSSLKSSDLRTIRGLEFLDTFKISDAQIDDDFQFLDQMSHLRDLSLSETSLALLQKLEHSPFLSHTKLRFLQIEFDGKIDDILIKRLQATCPGMTIIATDVSNSPRYLGIPFARLATDRLLNLGCTIRGNEPFRGIVDFTKELRPSETVPFHAIGVTLPSDLVLTPQIVADLAQLPAFHGLTAHRIKNIDLLSEAPVLKICDGIHLKDSDLTDKGFEALARICPIGYINVKKTQVTPETLKRIDRDYPFLVFHSDFQNGHIWLRDQLPFPDPKSVPSTSEMTDAEQIAFERETAEWVIQLGGRVSLKKAKGVAQQVGRLDQLPAEPFRITDIDFSKSDQKITLPDLSRLSRLLTLHSLNITNCHLEPGALNGLYFGESLTDLHIFNPPLKTSDLTATMGLEHLDTFKLDTNQVDDRFRFLELMPQLRDLQLYSPDPQVLEELTRAPALKQSNLRFLNLFSYGRQFTPEMIAELQKVKSGMTVIDNDESGHQRYLGIPVARQAAMKLLELGCTIKAKQGKTYHQALYPSETELFLPGRVILPPGLEITPEITMALAQLPRFFGLEADGVRNADLLADVPVLKLCGGLHLEDSDLSDQGFEALIRIHPDGYVHAAGTRVTRKKAEQLDREFRYAAFHTDFLEGKRWLAVRETDEGQKPAPTEPKPPAPAQTEAAPFDTEREIAEWVIGLGGYVKCRQTATESKISRELPETPFRLVMIDFRGSAEKPIRITEPERLNRLAGLQFLKLSGCQFEPGSLKTVRLSQCLRTMIINDSSLKTSDISTIQGLEFLDVLELNGEQIDDDFRFLELISNLRELRIKSPTQQNLQALAKAPALSKSKLRFLEVDFDDDIDPSLIQEIQTTRPGMTIVGVNLIRHRRYLGTPCAKLAANRLLDKGCEITGIEPDRKVLNYSKDLRPSPEVAFHVRDVTLPPGLEITPEIVADLSQLPGPLHGLIAKKVKNADRLAEVPLLKRCSGIMLDNTDLTDAGFEAFVTRNPDCYFQLNGSDITREKIKQIDQAYPLVTFSSDYGGNADWMGKLEHSAKSTSGTGSENKDGP